MNTKRLLTPALVLLLAAPLGAQQRPAHPERPERAERRERVAPVERAARGWLGIRFAEPEDGAAGLRVLDVSAGSPAQRSGVRSGDVVLRFGAEPANETSLARLRPKPGDTVRLRLRRDGRERDIPVVAAERPARVVIVRTPERTVRLDVDSLERAIRIHADTLAELSKGITLRLDREAIRLDSGVVRLDSLARVFRDEDVVRVFRRMELDSLGFQGLPDELRFGLFAGRRALAGAEFSEVNPELGSYFGTSRGLLVLRVAEGTPAARAGLKPGDVVMRADGEEVRTLAGLRRAIQSADAGEIRLEVLRERRPRELRLRWEGAETER